MNNVDKLIDKIITEVSLDERVNDGIFDIEKDSHMEAMREFLVKRGIDEETVKSFSNRVLEGKYPERQAYNVDGILCTFPTPEYKAAAIKRGTHFEENPKAGTPNVFGGEEKSQSSQTSDSEKPLQARGQSDQQPKKDTKTSLPLSQASAPVTPKPDDKEGGEKNNSSNNLFQSTQTKTTAAPQQTPASSPDAEDVTSEDPPVDATPPPSPKEKEANKNAIKTMLKGDDYMLEQVIKYVMYNAPHLVEIINEKLK